MPAPTIPIYSGTVPNRNQAPNEFSDNADDWLSYQAPLASSYNGLAVYINAVAEDVDADASSAAESELNAKASAEAAQGAANFQGRWADATGAAMLGTTYSHRGLVWLLLQNIPDITADEPSKNSVNWQLASFFVDETTAKGRKFGGQLSNLRRAMSNPFEQFTGVVFMGDSITWGLTLNENATSVPNTTLLDSARDDFLAPSFVNEVKRWIGQNYYDGAAPVLSNWSTSPSGEAIVEYTKDVILYPNRPPFSSVLVGTATLTDNETSGSETTGYQAILAVASGLGNEASVVFNFTGKAFDLIFSGVSSDAVAYELIVDGISQGTFDTTPGQGGVIEGFGNVFNHTFSYVKNKNIEIKIVGDGAASTRRLRIEAIRVPKTIRITNNAIIGTNSTRYYNRALNVVDTAILPDDSFSFVMIGTNDRGPDSTWPNGINAFKDQMQTIVDFVTPLTELIVMASTEVSEENQDGKIFTMQQIRGALFDLAEENSLDFIDNYSAAEGYFSANILADGLHPNTFGHFLIARNIQNCIVGT